MADIEVVIKISAEMYKWINDANKNLDDYKASDFWELIKNGTPLPKGHGKIIDVNDLLDRIGLEDTDENREDNVGEIITLEDIDYISAIIEADSEG